jgi:hypothetical protein
VICRYLNSAGRSTMCTLSSSSGSFPRGAPSNPWCDHAEVSRLAGKLLALGKRLVYSYFGPAELRSLREVLYDLHGLTQLHLAEEDEFDLTLLDL